MPASAQKKDNSALAKTVAVVNILARGFSQGRRQSCRPVLGGGRGFATDLTRVYLPWPLPAQFSQQDLVCAVALQCAPSKELLAKLPIAHLNAREKAALHYVESQQALSWVKTRWLGLTAYLDKIVIDRQLHRAVNAISGSDELLQKALTLASSQPAGLEVPAIFGQLPLTKSSLQSLGARRSQLESRMPWAAKKRMDKLNNWSIAIAGEGDTAAPMTGQPDADEEEEMISARKARLGIPYPEWNIFTQSYREDYCSVIESRLNAQGQGRTDVDSRLSVWFEQAVDKQWRHRLEDGSDIDVDAVVAACSDDLAGQFHSTKVYRERLVATRDVACAVLIDRSGSLSQAQNLKHELECANALAAAMDRAGERYGIFSFWSDTRFQVSVEVLRDFHDGTRTHLDAKRLKPRGYTRMGAAIRHVTNRLRKEPASRRILIILSDGIPCDEGYEGFYATADVAKAVEEAEQTGVVIAFVGIGRVPDDPLAEPLGDKFTRIYSISDLAPVLAEIHSRLAG